MKKAHERTRDCLWATTLRLFSSRVIGAIIGKKLRRLEYGSGKLTFAATNGALVAEVVRLPRLFSHRWQTHVCFYGLN